jgi:PPIC-type PPIASE domain
VIRRALPLALAALLLVACGLDRPEVARVGDRTLGFDQLRNAVALQRSLADLQGIPCGQKAGGETQRSACSRQALSGELLWLAVAPYAEQHGLGPSEAQIRQAVGQLEAQVGGEPLDTALTAHHVTREDLNELGRKLLTIRDVRLAVALHRAGEARLRALYQQQALDFTSIQVDHILVKTRGEAEAVYRQVKDDSEARFVAVAKRVSIEPGAKERGGELGTNVASTFDPAFARAAVALEEGQVSRPVHTSLGWHVIYLVDKEVTSFDEAKPRIVDSIADREFRAWLRQRARTLQIEVNPRYGRFVPRSFSVVPVLSTDPEAGTATPSPSSSP